MKIVQITFAVAYALLSFVGHAQDEDKRIVSSYYEFEEGSKEHLYGDNVILREKPSTEAKALDTMSIGAEITIVKRMKNVMEFNGLESHWFKVKSGRRTGYVLGGLIALDQVKIQNDTYLVVMAASGEYDMKIRARVLKPNGDFYGHESNLNTNSFYIDAFDDRGIKGIENMLRINLYAEACGVDGGELYLFNNGDALVEAISLSSVSDGGVFWFNESLVFPNDEGSYGDFVYYERELGHPIDDDMEISRSIIHNIVLRWEDGAFAPNISEMEFDEE